MILTVIGVLVLLGFLLLIASRLNPPRAELWLAVLFLYLIELLRLLPVGK
jgi:hypothetical protein